MEGRLGRRGAMKKKKEEKEDSKIKVITING